MIHASARSRYRALLPVVFTLAWPTMLEELMQTAVQYIDTAMVGRLGTDATAAVGSTTTVNWLVGSTIYAFGIGFLAAISQALGAKDGERARRVSAQSVLAVLVTGGFFTVLTVGLSDFVPAWMQVEPGMSFGIWGTHFVPNQTWWKAGGAKAFFDYMARCQSLLQRGLPDKQQWGDIGRFKTYRRTDGDTDIVFVCNPTDSAATASLPIAQNDGGKSGQARLYRTVQSGSAACDGS